MGDGVPEHEHEQAGAMRTRVRGVPTARRIDHLAFTVPALDEAVDFLVSVLGGELVYRLPALARSDDWMARHLDVHPRATATIALVRLGPTTNLEVFQYEAPDRRTVPPRVHDAGALSFGLLVDDVDAATAYLAAAGAPVLAGPETVPAGRARAGLRRASVLTPWGMRLDLRGAGGSPLPGEQPGARRFAGWPHWSNREDDAPQQPKVPTARGVDHIAYTVADLDAAVAFFADALGARLLYRGQASGADDGVEQALLRLGPTDNLELRRFAVPEARTRFPRNSDVGGHHLALHVDDVDRAVLHLLKVPGVQVLGAPETIPDGPIAGDRWVYLRTPIGLYLEVVHMPDGALPYERSTSARRRAARDEHWD